MIYRSKSAVDTKKIAAKIAKEKWGKFRVLTLSGELGAGKTTFVQGLASSLGIKNKIISPTFVLIREHVIPNISKKLFHIDLYRVENTLNLGLEEIFQDQNNIVLIEWPEKLTQKLPKNTVKINIKITSENTREITVNGLL